MTTIKGFILENTELSTAQGKNAESLLTSKKDETSAMAVTTNNPFNRFYVVSPVRCGRVDLNWKRYGQASGRVLELMCTDTHHYGQNKTLV